MIFPMLDVIIIPLVTAIIIAPFCYYVVCDLREKREAA